MDAEIRELGRRWMADPHNPILTEQYISAVRRLEAPKEKPSLTKSSIEAALEKHLSLWAEWEVSKGKTNWHLEWEAGDYQCISFNELAAFLAELQLDPSDVDLEADAFTNDGCSCGSCHRHYEGALIITFPLREPTDPTKDT